MADIGGPVGQSEASWPVPGVRAVMDALNDAVLVCDQAAMVRYANPATERLLGWPSRSLEGRPAIGLVPERLADRVARRFQGLVGGNAPWLAGRQFPVPIRRHDGSDAIVDVVLSVIDHPWAGRAVVAIIRPRSGRHLQRWGRLTSDLLEILAAAPEDEPPLERLLATLGRRLNWDVTTLWEVTPEGELVCRHVSVPEPGVAVSFREEKAKDPSHGADGIPRWVLAHDEPLWVPDVVADGRFSTDAIKSDGLRSAYAFPVRYRGACVGVVKMLSRRRKDVDPGLVELMAVVSENLGEFLHVFSQAHDREQLVAELQQIRQSHEFLLLASRVLADATDYRQTVERLAEVAVPVLADLCLIDVQDEGARVRRVAAWHADPAKRALTEKLRAQYPPDPGGAHPSVEVMRTGRSSWAAEMTDEFLRRTSRDEQHYLVLKQLGFTSYMTVPLGVRGRVLGTVTLVSAGSGRRFSAKDLSAAEELAGQVASVVERARIFDREKRISHELQKALLPARFPQVTGWSFAARYLPATEGAEVGGDWFDVIPLEEGAVALVVGDVEGHDIEAAKAMGGIRHVLSLLVVEEGAPGAALRRLNRYLVSTGAERLTTVLLGVLDTTSGALTLASAGHPPALAVKGPRSWELALSPGPPLGVADGCFAEHVTLLSDECLVLFTDGLIERRGAEFNDGFARLQRTVASAPSYQPQQLVDHILAEHLDGPGADDVAILVVKRQIGARTA